MTQGINWGNNNLMGNIPYNYMPQIQMPAPHMEVIRVHGEQGANAFQMGPNSSVILLDETDPLIWFVQTDGAGFKTITPYDITIHTTQPAPDIKNIDERLLAIDKRLLAIEEAMNDESDS